MAESSHHQPLIDPMEREFCCLTYKDCETVAICIIWITVLGAAGCGVALFVCGNNEDRKDELKYFMAASVLVGILVYIAKQICRWLATKKTQDVSYAILSLIFSSAVYCAFLYLVFHKKHHLTIEQRSWLRIASVLLGLIGAIVMIIISVMKDHGNQDEYQRGGTIRTIARSFRTIARPQNRVHQIPQEPSTRSAVINDDCPPSRESELPSERESTRTVRNPNQRSATEKEIHRGPSTSRDSEQAQASSSVETDVERQRIRRGPTPFPHETTAADEYEPIMTRSRTQQQKQSTSRQKSQEIQLLPGQLEESSGMESGELRRKRVEPAETDRQLRPRAAKKTS